MALREPNYTNGKGELWFSPFKPGTLEPAGFEWVGNVSEFNLTIEAEKLEHFSSYKGIKEKDRSVTTQVNRTGSTVTDDISAENLAKFFFGSSETLTVVGGTITDEPIEGVVLGRSYQLGSTVANPGGARKLVYPGTGPTAFSLKLGATPLVDGVDFELDPEIGWLTILSGGTVTEGDDVLVSYTTAASTRQRTISGSTEVTGALKYISRNPVGQQKDFYLPYVSISPNGDFGLISDEWLSIPLNLDVQKRTDMEAVYIDGRPI